MHFQYSEKVIQLQARLQDFMERYIWPAMPEWIAEVENGNPHPSIMEDLKTLARSQDLWNLFLPGLRAEEQGQALTNLEYAPLAEIMGRVVWASEVFNCSAPDTGNMEVLHLFGSAEQKRNWLTPLLGGEMRSCFAMTEPDVASSDATNIQTQITGSGDDYIINGRKWFISGAAHPLCRFAILMGQTNPEAEVHRRQSMVIVPLDSPGVEIVRNISVMNHVTPEGHCEKYTIWWADACQYYGLSDRLPGLAGISAQKWLRTDN